MFFLSFLLLGGIVWILGLALAMAARRQAGVYSALSVLSVVAGLILFTLFSWWAGIIPLKFGDGGLITYSVSFPHWYLARGALGIAIMFVGLVGIVSPAIAASMVSRKQSPLTSGKSA